MKYDRFECHTRVSHSHAPESTGNCREVDTLDGGERIVDISTPYWVPGGNASVGYLPTNSSDGYIDCVVSTNNKPDSQQQTVVKPA